MKKLQVLIIAFLIPLSIFAFASMQAKAATALISLGKTSGYVGDTVTVSAGPSSGFAFDSIITIKFDGATLATSPSQVKTPVLAGSFNASFTVPVAAVGNHTVFATDASSNTGSATFTVFASLNVTVLPTSWTMDVGQSKTFSATASGGSGSYTSYQWYVGGSAQSGATASTFNFAPGSMGSYSITVTVTDSLGTTSAQSSAASVTVSVSPTVSVVPVGPVTLDVGQVQVFTATPIGGSGTIHYQWYLDAGAVGSDSASYSYVAAGASHSVTCKVTDSASSPVTSPASNAVSVMVNPALVSPTVSASPGTVNQGQSSSLTSSAVSTGTSPYTYQWLQKAPGGSYAVVGSNSASLSFVTSGATATGSWSFILQVTDSVGAAMNSSAVSVMVNIAPLDHFVFSSVGVQTAGTSFSITITAKNAFNNTLTNYNGSNILNVSTGTISPTSTGVFSSGVWTGSVTVTDAGSGIWLFTSGSGMSGTSGTFTVNPGILDHFTFDAVNDQTAGSAFSITVTAKDASNNTVTGYTGTPSLRYSAGTISPATMNTFVGGVGSTSVTVTAAGSSVTITANDGTYTGTSNSFTVTITPTPPPTPTPTPKQTSTPTPKPTPVPSPTPTSSAATVPATTDSGSTVYLVIRGNVNSSQLSNVMIATNQSAATTTVSFTLTGETGITGFSNLTIPKIAVHFGTTPIIYVDNQPAQDQGYTQDAYNYYVWYTTHFSTHQVTILFAISPPTTTSLELVLALAISIVAAILVSTVVIKRLRDDELPNPEN